MRALIIVLVLLFIFMTLTNITNASDTSSKKVLFIHHSTGGNLLRQGDIRNLLSQSNPTVELWDHSYNLYSSLFLSKILGPITFRTGLSDAKGKITGKDYGITISNNSPKEFAEIFSRDPSDSTLSKILEYDVVIFKNCFPTTKIESDEKLKEHINYYNQIRDSLKKYPDKTFIVFTPPPLRAEVTEPEWTKRARTLADYMSSSEYVNESDNLKVFNFFDLLADSEEENKNMLKREYTSWFYKDSHPNKKANKEVGLKFIKYLTTVLDN